MRSLPRQLNIAIGVMLAIFPLLVAASLYLFVLRARWQLGYWPTPCQPDPKTLGFLFHGAQVWLGLLSFPWVSLAAMIWAAICRIRSADYPVWEIAGLAFQTPIVLVGVIMFDPGDFWKWFFD